MSFDLVLIGGTGDLAWRKLMPALFQAWRHGTLPAGGRILAVSREDMDSAAYRVWLQQRFQDLSGPTRPTAEALAAFTAQVHYLQVDLAQDAHYPALRRWLKEPAAQEGRADGPAEAVVFYLATSPHLFPQVCRQLGAMGLNGPEVRVVLEKPLGHDLESARAINRAVGAVFGESQALRIDHYLGKSAVQNLTALRFGNALFEPLWRRDSIASIEITLAESLGVGTRGDFYDRTGALRDMVQNHALQLLTMIAMEPPASAHANAIRNEKLKVLQALKPFDAASARRDVVRGQYRAGVCEGRAVPGYLEERNVPAGSRCETFVALRTEVCNWRWAGVPFYLRTGKRLAAGTACIVVNFRAVPHPIFAGPHPANRLVIKLQPADGLELHLLAAQGPTGTQALAPVSLDLDFDHAFAEDRVGAYERLLLEAIHGRLNLFVRNDEQEEAWRWVEPVLQAWREDDAAGLGPRPYAAGSWGPAAASALVARDGFTWAEEQ
ncbi:glucose-6-phosphate dehydrogenase [Azohydromonas lata]|uniref:glucose-6-phosphate dehydrogenase n=1 Tax=Azohydromonas lata TaxID=45677 RepID=UPI0008378F1D|nr:glucose-6-phosphate dehydrogenase [Azohydromonas lata]